MSYDISYVLTLPLYMTSLPSNIDFVVKYKSTETTWEQLCSEIQKPDSRILGSDFN